MPSPNDSSAIAHFTSSTNSLINPLLNEELVKWSLAADRSISYSFPWQNGASAYWQANYSAENEPGTGQHFGLNSSQMVAVRQALQLWSNVANIKFVETADTATQVGDLRFAFSSVLPDSTWGWASYPDDYWAKAGDVWISSREGSSSEWQPGTYNFEALMHEIGHALGLKHPGSYGGSSGPFLPAELDNRNYSVMSYNDAKNIYPQAANGDWDTYFIWHNTPMVLDIAAIQHLYGANTSYRSGDDVYRFDPATPFFETIWDAGGTDLLDLANYRSDCIIDLRPGSYSKLTIAAPANNGGQTATYDGSNALGIAYGCLIENVNAGSGNDTIYGNDAANLIRSGGGTNVIDAGKGMDTLLYDQARASYSINITADNVTVSGIGVQDQVSNAERFRFADKVLAFDTEGATSTGGIYRLYKAAFDRVPDAGGLGYWIRQAELGKDTVRMATDFLYAEEFRQLYQVDMAQPLSTTQLKQLLTGFYQNVLGRAPDASGLDFYQQAVQTGQKTVGLVLAEIADSPENYTLTLAGIQQGVEYQLYA